MSDDFYNSFIKASTPSTDSYGYFPQPTSVVPEQSGSVYMAHMRQENSIGSFLASNSVEAVTNKPLEIEQLISLVPVERLNNLDKYIGLESQEQIQERTAQLDMEDRDKALLAAHPWRALAYSLDPLEPTNWLPLGKVAQAAKGTIGVGKAILSSGLSAALASGVNETILQNTQLTRELSESYFNTFASGILGGALGGLGAIVSPRLNAKQLPIPQEVKDFEARQRAHQEIVSVYRDENKSLTPLGTLSDEDLANMPLGVQKAMRITPMGQGLTSPFPSAKLFASQAYEHNYFKVKNTNGITDGISIERSIKLDRGHVSGVMANYTDLFYDMHGVKGFFRGTQTRLRSENPMNFDAFDEAVSQVLTTKIEHPVRQVNEAARLLRTEVYEKYAKIAQELGMLPENLSVRNAADYFITIYNKNKIIEEGGRSARGAGTFAQYVYDQFKASQQVLKDYLDSPDALRVRDTVKDLQARANKLPKKELETIQKKINKIDKRINTEKKLIRKKSDTELSKINKSIEDIQSKIKTHQSDIEKESKSIKSQVEKEIESFVESNKIYSKRKDKLDSIASKVQRKIDLADKSITKDKGKLSVLKPDDRKVKTIQNNIDKQENKKSVYFKEIEVLERDIKALDNFIKDGDKRINQLKKSSPTDKIDQIKKSISNLKNDINKLQESKKVTPAEIQKRQSLIDSLEKNKQDLVKSKTLTKKQKENIKQKIESLEKELVDKAPDRAKDYNNELYKIHDNDDVTWSHVEQTIDNILGNTEGKLINPVLENITSGGKPFKNRKLLIDQEGARPWQITNARQATNVYARAMIPVIRLTEHAQNLGFKTIEQMKIGLGNQIKKEYDTLSKGVTGKAAQKLKDELVTANNMVSNTIDMLMGVYGNGENVLGNKMVEYYRNVLKWNQIRLLGHMTLSSIPDMGNIIANHGYYRFMHDGVLRAASSMSKIDKTDLRAIGHSIESYIGSRIKSYSEHQGLSTNPGVFTKTLDSLTHNFGNLSLVNMWNDIGHQLAGGISINRTLTAIHKVAEGGKLTQKEARRLAQLGIDQTSFEHIYKFTKNNKDTSGAYFADWGNWDITNKAEAKALREFQGSVGKEIDNLIIVPGLGDKPRLAYSETGKLLFQFKTFFMASTNRILYAGIQRKGDAELYQGMSALIGLGALSYLATSFAKGKEPDLSYTNLFHESVDRSGVLGLWGEVANVGMKALNLGEVSRYQTRDVAGALLGATGGGINELINLANKTLHASLGDTVITTDDAQKFARLLPYQNLFYFDKLNKSIIRNISEDLGAIPVD